MFKHSFASVTRFPAFFALLIIFASAGALPARAMPSFARQTGGACTLCHVGSFGPQLNDYGRQFKLNGYVWGDAKTPVPGLSAMALTSWTSTSKGQPGGAAPGFGDNNNFALDQASLFYAGRIFAKVGAFVQGTYDGIGKVFTIDNVDVRFADQGTLGGKPLVYGLSLNNNPTAQDLWNTTPAWGFPFTQSGLAPSPGAASLIDGSLSQQVGGMTAYAMWNGLVFIDGGVYATLPRRTQSALGVDPDDENQIKGAAPYWRAALQHTWGPAYVAIGTFGMIASTFPGRDKSAGADRYSDLGFDATYQMQIGDRNSLVTGITYIHENQNLTASKSLGLSDNSADKLNTLRARATYTLDNTYGISAGIFNISGTQDIGIYAADPIDGGAAGRPNSNGYIFEATYTPFGKDSSWLSPWVNLRLALQYTIYSKFNGGNLNYDGFGRNASDNNTLFASAMFAF